MRVTREPAQQSPATAATAAAPAEPFAPGPPTRKGRARGGAAALVAAGILLSRVAGLIRQRVFGHYLGTSDAADAYNAAFKIPNFLQNLLGEGVLSASFIPVFAALRAPGTPEGEREARKVASAVAGLLTLVTGVFALIGILLTPFLIDAIAPGFSGDKRLLTIRLVQIFFPGIALLVLSAFCIGVLNSHHRFFLSYVAPVVWSAAVVSALVVGGEGLHAGQARLARIAAFGAVAGGALQLSVQLPVVIRLLGGVRPGGLWPSLGRGSSQVREVVRNFVPVVAGRGVVQLSAYLDSFIASWLPSGAVAALAYAQTIYLLPISLFGMSVSAAALPSMSAAQGEGDAPARREALRAQIARGLRNIAYPVIPSVVALFALGDVICAALFRTGQFGPDQVRYVSRILLGSTVGLLAATLARLYSSAFYALRDTRTPLRYAILRVVITGVLGLACGLWLPRALHLDPALGAVGLTASAGIAGWVEFALLRRGVNARVGPVDLPGGLQLRLWGSAFVAGACGVGARMLLDQGPLLLRGAVTRAALVLGLFGGVYLVLTLALGVDEARGMVRRLSPRRR
ncbi:MAG: murein biosynthesis integral membrane protein MurJ [Myxococcales bacterium]